MRAFWARVRQGLTILRDRRRYFREVWLVQLGGWCFRFTAFWFLLDAFNVGGSVRNVLLVLGVNAVAAAVPFTPGGAGVQQAFLVKVFAGTASGATVAAYSVGQQIAIAAFTLALGLRRARGRSSASARSRRSSRPGAPTARAAAADAARGALLQPLARLAHERDRLGEDGRHHRADLLGLLGRRALDVDAVDGRDRHVDRELDRVVGPGQPLLALHLLGELRHAPLELVGVAEHASEAFHATILAMAPSVEGAGVALTCVERGAGAPVLLVHGLAADAEAMAPVAQALAGEARVIAYDRRGYGASGAPGALPRHDGRGAGARTPPRCSARSTPAPAVVCGDGFGALVALDLAKRHRALVRAAVLCRPAAVHVRARGDRGARRPSTPSSRRRCARAGPQAGVEAWLGGRVGRPAALERARAAHRAFFADYAGLASWPVTRRELRALDVPAVVLTGPRSPPHVVAAADALAALLPAARRADDGDLAAAARSLLASP